MPKKPSKGERKPATEVPEVQALLELQQEIAELKADNPDVFMQYADLVERHNAALEVAEATVKSQGISCGPFDNYSSRDDYDAERMVEELGEKLFLRFGGSIEKKTVYKVDKSQLESAHALGHVSDDSLSHFHKVVRSYHAPKKLVV
jgi:hypothetical protein